jgi:hypothetical protein
MQQMGTGSRSGGGSGYEKRKRKRQADPAVEPNPRSRPRPRLQDTHGLSDLQQITQDPSTHRKSIRQICKLYDLDLKQLMYEANRSSCLMNLPIFVDEYTEIDTWDTLRTHLHSTAYPSGTKMQRIRAKPATRNHVAKNDPVLYVDSGQETARTARLHGGYQAYLIIIELVKLNT